MLRVVGDKFGSMAAGIVLIFLGCLCLIVRASGGQMNVSYRSSTLEPWQFTGLGILSLSIGLITLAAVIRKHRRK